MRLIVLVVMGVLASACGKATCSEGLVASPSGGCTIAAKKSCPDGQLLNRAGECVAGYGNDFDDGPPDESDIPIDTGMPR